LLHHAPGDEWIFGEPKTARSRRRRTLPETAIVALREHRRRHLQERLAAGPIWQDGGRRLVFVTTDGQPIDGIHLLRYRFLPILRQAGLPRIRFHDLRHTAATLLLLQGINPKIVSELLGHSSVAITLDLYSHVLPDMQQQAAAAMDMVLTR
jgi:integrase